MATFEPQVQSGDFRLNYQDLPRPTTMPIPDKSTGAELEIVGGGIQAAANLADEGVKGVIKDDIQSKVDAQRDQFTDALMSLRNAAAKTNPADSMAQASDQDLMPDRQPQPPQNIQTGLSRLQSLQSAYSGNKLSETMYYQRLNSMVKDMRATYPGYRDYIDQEVSRITGGNPANEVIRSAIQDINRQTSDSQKEHDYYEKAIVNSGYDGADQALTKFQQTGDINFAQHWLTLNGTAQGKVQRAISDFKLGGASRDDLQQRAEIAAATVAEHAATAFHASRNAIMNDPNSTTSQQLEDWFNNVASHPTDFTPEDIRLHAIQYNALANRNAQETLQVLRNTTVKDQNGQPQSMYNILGPQRVQQIIDGTIKTLYNTQIQMLKDENVGLLGATNKIVGDVGDNSALRIVKDGGTVGDIARTGQAINKIWPTMSPELQTNMLGTTANIGDKLRTVVNQQKRNAFNQDGRGTYDGAYTFRQALEEQDKAQSVLHFTDAEKSQAASEFLRLSKGLTEKDPRVQDAAIKTFFDPANRGVLNKFADDYYDQSKGIIVRGRQGAFSMLTAPDVSNAIYKRSKESGGMQFENYKDWARTEAVSGLTTMAQTWNKNENDFAKNKLLPSGMPTRTDHHFYWDTDKHQIGVTDLNGNVIDPETSWRLNPDLFAVRNANLYLSHLKNIAETEGSNVDAFLFKTLKDAGWSPSAIDQKGSSKIPVNIMKAVIAGHGGAQ